MSGLLGLHLSDNSVYALILIVVIGGAAVSMAVALSQGMLESLGCTKRTSLALSLVSGTVGIIALLLLMYLGWDSVLELSRKF